MGRFPGDVEVFSDGSGDTDCFLKLKEKKCNNAAFHAGIIHPLGCGLNLPVMFDFLLSI